MKLLLRVVSVGLGILFIGTFAAAKGFGGPNASNQGCAKLGAVVANLPVQELTAVEKSGLMQMREEEKLARDVYQAMFEKWGLAVFANIGRSEQRHMAIIKVLLTKYDLVDPVVDSSTGIFTSSEILTLYNDLVAKGRASLVDALQVGATVEDLDIKDLYGFLRQTDNSDIKTVYQNLAKGSRNHLRAFTYQLSLNGAAYKAQYLTVGEIGNIINTPRERGWMDEYGHLTRGPGRFGRGRGGAGMANARNGFVDADGDGVCDHRGGRMVNNGNGRGRGKGVNYNMGLNNGNGSGNRSVNKTGYSKP